MKKLLLTLCLLLPLPALSASFNCDRAKTATEKTICGNRSLNDKDVIMVTKLHFMAGLYAMGGRGALYDQQEVWRKERDRCAGNLECLNRRYDQRIRQLDDAYQHIDRPVALTQSAGTSS